MFKREYHDTTLMPQLFLYFCKTLQMALENKNKETEKYINPETYAKFKTAVSD